MSSSQPTQQPHTQGRYALIVAGGKGLRMGAELPKQFLPLAGRPVLMHTLERFAPLVERLVLVLPTEQMGYWQELCHEYHFTLPHELAPGGATRFDSVASGLSLLPQRGLVAVHDGVRPLVTEALIERCYEAAAHSGAALPATPITDSLRQRQGEHSQAVDRADYVAVQTPQTFELEQLHAAYAQPYRASFTDDASVWEAAGYPAPTLIAGQSSNIKLTQPLDLQLASLLLSQRL